MLNECNNDIQSMPGVISLGMFADATAMVYLKNVLILDWIDDTKLT